MTGVRAFVKIDDKLIKNLQRSIEHSDDAIAQAVAETAYFHANYVLGTLPEAVKGKLDVKVSEIDANSAEINYTAKAGVEASTLSTGADRGAIFLPLDKLGQFTSRNPVRTSGGDEGIFISKIDLAGRPAITAYLMKYVEENMDKADEVAAEYGVQRAIQELKQWFAANGIVWNASAERYQATHDVMLPTGANIRGGQFVAGGF